MEKNTIAVFFHVKVILKKDKIISEKLIQFFLLMYTVENLRYIPASEPS